MCPFCYNINVKNKFFLLFVEILLDKLVIIN